MDRADKLVILLLTADPSDASRLRVGEEFREIGEKLQLGREREVRNRNETISALR